VEEILQGGFYFHPTDEDLSVGTPKRKKPLGRIKFPYRNSESAVAALRACSRVRAVPEFVCPFPFGERRHFLEENAAWRQRFLGMATLEPL
jgi:hypothetical protein